MLGRNTPEDVKMQGDIQLATRSAEQVSMQLVKVTNDLHQCIHGHRAWDTCERGQCQASRELLEEVSAALRTIQTEPEPRKRGQPRLPIEEIIYESAVAKMTAASMEWWSDLHGRKAHSAATEEDTLRLHAAARRVKVFSWHDEQTRIAAGVLHQVAAADAFLRIMHRAKDELLRVASGREPHVKPLVELVGGELRVTEHIGAGANDDRDDPEVRPAGGPDGSNPRPRRRKVRRRFVRIRRMAAAQG